MGFAIYAGAVKRILNLLSSVLLCGFVASGCGGGGEDPVLVPATMAPTTLAATTMPPTTLTVPVLTTLPPTSTTMISISTTTSVPVATTTTLVIETGPTSVTVDVGDSLSKIAKRYDTTVEVLAALNGICDINKISVGQTILLVTEKPEETESDSGATSVTVIVEVGDSLSKIAKRYDTTVENLMAANSIENPNIITVGQELVVSGITPVLPDVEPPIC